MRYVYVLINNDNVVVDATTSRMMAINLSAEYLALSAPEALYELTMYVNDVFRKLTAHSKYVNGSICIDTSMSNNAQSIEIKFFAQG